MVMEAAVSVRITESRPGMGEMRRSRPQVEEIIGVKDQLMNSGYKKYS